MSGWGRGGGAHLLLGGASVPLATRGQGRAQGPRCREQSLRLGGSLGTWSWQVRLGKQGGWNGEMKNLFVVCLLAVLVPTGSRPPPLPLIFTSTSLGPGWGPALSSWI